MPDRSAISKIEKKKHPYKNASRKEILKIREDMTGEEQKELDRKVLVLFITIILAVILVSVIIYFIQYI